MSAFHEVLVSRQTVHDYAAEPLPDGALGRALQAALAAPNHRMTEPWRFVRVGGQARQLLVDVSLDLKRSKAGGQLDASTEASVSRKMLNPAELIVACQVRTQNPVTAKEDYAAMACAVQNFMLSLWAEGVGSKWSTGAVTTDERTYACLGVDPEEQEIVGFIWAGVAAKGKPKVPRSLDVGAVFREVP